MPIAEALVPFLETWLAHRCDPPGFPTEPVPWLWPACRGLSPWVEGPPGRKPVHQLQAAAGRAGIQGAGWQVLRRSLATHLEAHGAGSAMVARILRHTGRVDSEFYRQADIANMRQAVSGLEF